MDYIGLVKQFHQKFGHPVSENIGIPTKELCKLRLDLLKEELRELEEAIEENDIVKAADAFADLQYVLSGAILVFGLHDKFSTIFQEVQNSNMSKLGRDGKPIYREDGKILKGPDYFSPNIEGILLGTHVPINHLL